MPSLQLGECVLRCSLKLGHEPWDFAMLKLGPWDPRPCDQVPEN